MSSVLVRRLGLCDYSDTWSRMRRLTDKRDETTPDEIWLLEHPPVYTQGQSCSALPRGHAHIPVVRSDRGGQITYHGPGQLVAYVMVDLRRLGTGVKPLVHSLEQCVIDLLAGHRRAAERVGGAPGVYVEGRKIAALGLRVRRGATFHGLSLNVDMDLSPFASIDPCGYRGLEVTQLRDLGIDLTPAQAARELGELIRERVEELGRR